MVHYSVLVSYKAIVALIHKLGANEGDCLTKCFFAFPKLVPPNLNTPVNPPRNYQLRIITENNKTGGDTVPIQLKVGLVFTYIVHHNFAILLNHT